MCPNFLDNSVLQNISFKISTGQIKRHTHHFRYFYILYPLYNYILLLLLSHIGFKLKLNIIYLKVTYIFISAFDTRMYKLTICTIQLT